MNYWDEYTDEQKIREAKTWEAIRLDIVEDPNLTPDPNEDPHYSPARYYVELGLERPKVIVTSSDDADQFNWQSVNWPHPRDEMIGIVSTIVSAGADVPDCIRLLERAGFEVLRDNHV